ncbi:uncharacterized protein LOC108218671 isoform X2 [Daucus carota subsp. sativus]|uniref:uncharacterized protein LOC108218671 isoform X2 n=1 Tax=Daucus carota subsp. sativus TaxID=79200 RepID=UPI0007EF5516|nr:PREDICTED: uncharacterized protein LOC108218671 isoform X2 [Daucus carota subsp. sativus]
MVAIMSAKLREKVAGFLAAAKSARSLNSKLQSLQHLKQIFSDDADTDLLSEFLPALLEFHSDSSSPVRKLVIEIVGGVGLKHVEFLPDIVPVLIAALQDSTPAVARQSGTCGMDLFRSTLVKIAIQGIYSSELDDSLKLSWVWMLKFKDEMYSLAFKPGSDGRRLVALKFVAATILLYTPDPSGSSEPPSNHSYEEKFDGFNMAWLRGGHPVLNVGDSSMEASKSLGLLLDQLRYSKGKSLNNSAMIVLINSLSEIARKRPALYGRIMPVLLALDPSSSANKGMHVLGAHYPLKNAFFACLKCSHPGAAPWRDRLVGALREMRAGDMAEEALHELCQEEKPSLDPVDAMDTDIRRKRSGTPDASDLAAEDDISGKRARQTPEASIDQCKSSSSAVSTSRGDGDNGPVQQLVSMFAALVAQGEKAVGSLQILISSISADLLAEVVMANMRHLPSVRPKDEELELDKELHTTYGSKDSQFKQLSSFLRDILSPSSPSPILDARPSASNNLENPKLEEQEVMTPIYNDVGGPLITETAVVTVPTDIPISSSEGVPSVNDVSLAIAPEVPDIGFPENGIPGLESSVHSYGLPETLAVSSVVGTDLEDASQDQAISLGRSSQERIPSISTDRSEELSPKAVCTDATSINSSTATSLRLPSQLVLPKMSAPVISLDGEQMDNIQKMSFMRIVEAYKHIAVAGGSQVRFSLLAYLGVALPLDVDPWKMVETHVLSDYMSHQGHELTLRVLYKLFGEAEANADFLYSTNATSVYEMFLLKVAETLRDAFPASDKSLSRLLGEVPYLPKSILKLLECLCCPGNNDKDEKAVHSGDRVTQGLSTVWSLILLRPPTRDVCLKIALQSAVHHLEEVRMKAIRLVANKLYPISSLTQNIEDYAKEMLISVTSTDKTNAVGLNLESQKEHLNASVSEGTVPKDVSSDAHQLNTCESSSLSSVSEMQRCMSLYFALCTKKHSLFREVFVVYNSMSDVARQAVHGQIPILVRTIGTSSQLLEIISDPPTGSVNLLMQVLQTLTDGTVPSPELISTIRKLYDSNLKDAQILIPVLPFLPKHEVLLLFPHLVNLPLDKFQGVITRTLQGSSQSSPVLTPGEVLIAIHKVDPERDGIPLKKVTDACNACFGQGQIFTQQVLAEVLNQLVEQIPLPMLFMRTVLQTIGAYPSLVDFIMNILSRLVSKQIWKYPKLWVGFLRCALMTKPQSFGVLLQLPPPQLENAMNKTPALKAPLVAHASQPNIQPTLPRSVLVVLGIVSDPQAASPTEKTQPQSPTAEAQPSDATAEAQPSGATEEAQPPSADGSGSEAEKSKETSTVSNM